MLRSVEMTVPVKFIHILHRQRKQENGSTLDSPSRMTTRVGYGLHASSLLIVVLAWPALPITTGAFCASTNLTFEGWLKPSEAEVIGDGAPNFGNLPTVGFPTSLKSCPLSTGCEKVDRGMSNSALPGVITSQQGGYFHVGPLD